MPARHVSHAWWEKQGCLVGKTGPVAESFGGTNIFYDMSFLGLLPVFWGYDGSYNVQEMSSSLQSLLGAGLPLTSLPEGKS